MRKRISRSIIILIVLIFSLGLLGEIGFKFLTKNQISGHLIEGRLQSNLPPCDTDKYDHAEIGQILNTKKKGIYKIFYITNQTCSHLPINPNTEITHLLKHYLQCFDANRQFEIIKIPLQNGTMADLQNMAENLLKYQPDLVILSPGYQEFTSKAISNTVITKNKFLNHLLHNSQLISYFHNKFFYDKTPPALDAITREIILDEFNSHLDQTIANLQAQKIPVILLNTASNILDQAPVSLSSGFLDKRLDQLTHHGINSYKQGNFEEAEIFFNKVLKKQPNNALCNYYLGKMAYFSHNFEIASAYLEKAKQMDTSGNRPPAEINQIIFKVAITRGCPLVETDKLLAEQSYQRITGRSLIAGPANLRLFSNALLAKACFETIKNFNLLPLENKPMVSSLPVTPFDTLYDEILCHLYDPSNPDLIAPSTESTLITSDIAELAVKFSANKITWEDSMNLLYEKYTRERNYKMALKVIENLVLENPFDLNIINKASQTASMLGDSQLIIHYAKLSFSLRPSFPMAQLLFIHYLKLDQPERALPLIQFAENNNKNMELLNNFHTSTCKIIQLKELLKRQPDSISLKKQIAREYLAMGNDEIASRYRIGSSHF